VFPLQIHLTDRYIIPLTMIIQEQKSFSVTPLSFLQLIYNRARAFLQQFCARLLPTADVLQIADKLHGGPHVWYPVSLLQQDSSI